MSKCQECAQLIGVHSQGLDEARLISNLLRCSQPKLTHVIVIKNAILISISAPVWSITCTLRLVHGLCTPICCLVSWSQSPTLPPTGIVRTAMGSTWKLCGTRNIYKMNIKGFIKLVSANMQIIPCKVANIGMDMSLLPLAKAAN